MAPWQAGSYSPRASADRGNRLRGLGPRADQFALKIDVRPAEGFRQVMEGAGQVLEETGQVMEGTVADWAGITRGLATG